MQKQSTAYWPICKIDRNLASVPTGRRRCVLLSTGGLNPVHLGHVAMFDKAKQELEGKHGFAVVGGFLSPSHDLYLNARNPHGGAIPAVQRLEMCAAATKDHEFLAVGAWESSVDGYWPDFPEVVAELQRTLNHQFAGDAPEVVYLCGEDHFRHAKGAVSPLCVVARAGRAVAGDKTRGIYAIENDPDGPFDQISATKVRKARHNNDFETLSTYLHPDVLLLLLAYYNGRT